MLSILFLFIILFVFIIAVVVVSASRRADELDKAISEKGGDMSQAITCGEYAGGHPDMSNQILSSLIVPIKGYFEIFDHYSSSTHSVGSIPINSITNIDAIDKSTMEKEVTLGRVLLVGVFALAWKKDKANEAAFIRIHWKGTFDNVTMFKFEGDGAMMKAQKASNELRRAYEKFIKLPEEEKKSVATERCSIVLTDSGNEKFAVLKYLQQNFDMSISAAKDKVDSTPCTIVSNIEKSLAETAKQELENLGATIELQ